MISSIFSFRNIFFFLKENLKNRVKASPKIHIRGSNYVWKVRDAQQRAAARKGGLDQQRAGSRAAPGTRPRAQASAARIAQRCARRDVRTGGGRAQAPLDKGWPRRRLWTEGRARLRAQRRPHAQGTVHKKNGVSGDMARHNTNLNISLMVSKSLCNC